MSVKVVDMECHCPKCGSDFTDDVIVNDLSAELAALVAERDALRGQVATLRAALVKAEDQLSRAELVQDRSVSIIKQVIRSAADDIRAAIAETEAKP